MQTHRAFFLTSFCLLVFLGFTVASAQGNGNDLYLPLIANGGEIPPPRPTHTNTPVPTSTPTTIVIPTSTPTPTVTSTPTTIVLPTSTSTPTDVPGNVQVLDASKSYYLDSLGDLHMVGEVQNNHPINVQLVKLTVSLLNSSGGLLDTTSTFAQVKVVEASDKSCFNANFGSPTYGPSDIDTVLYEYEYFFGGYNPNLFIYNTNTSYDPGTGTFQKIGMIQNYESTQVENVAVSGTVYSGLNGTGLVMRCDYGNVGISTLDPSQSTTFSVRHLSLLASDIGSHRVQTIGDLQ